MRILGIDPGFAITGFSIIDYEGNKFKLITSGAILTEVHTSFPLRLEQIYNQLNSIITEYKPDAMAIEELFFNNNAKTAINVAQATPLQVKQAVVGYGRADKMQVQRMVKMILHEENLPKLDDTTDSMAMAICHAHSSKFVKSL